MQSGAQKPAFWILEVQITLQRTLPLDPNVGLVPTWSSIQLPREPHCLKVWSHTWGHHRLLNWGNMTSSTVFCHKSQEGESCRLMNLWLALRAISSSAKNSCGCILTNQIDVHDTIFTAVILVPYLPTESMAMDINWVTFPQCIACWTHLLIWFSCNAPSHNGALNSPAETVIIYSFITWELLPQLKTVKIYVVNIHTNATGNIKFHWL